jgi:hypothetical protein
MTDTKSNHQSQGGSDEKITIPKYLYDMLLEFTGMLNDDSSHWWRNADQLSKRLHADLKSGTITTETHKKTLGVMDECGMISHSEDESSTEDETTSDSKAPSNEMTLKLEMGTDYCNHSIAQLIDKQNPGNYIVVHEVDGACNFPHFSEIRPRNTLDEALDILKKGWKGWEESKTEIKEDVDCELLIKEGHLSLVLHTSWYSSYFDIYGIKATDRIPIETFMKECQIKLQVVE